MSAFAVCLVAACIGLALVARLRPGFRPRCPGAPPLDRDEAVTRAARHARELTGMDVTGWPFAAAGWADPGLLHRPFTGTPGGDLDRSALCATWRVRFVGSRDTVVVGGAPGGEVTYLDVRGDRHERRRAAVDCTPADLGDPAVLRRLDGGLPDGLWQRSHLRGLLHESSTANAVGDGLDAEVTTAGSHVVRVRLGSSTPAGRDVPVAGRSQALATAVPLCALLFGAVALWRAGLPPAVRPALLLAGLFFAAATWILPRLVEEALVHHYDDRFDWRHLRRRHGGRGAVANLVGAATVFAAVGAGLPLLAQLTGAPASAVEQLAVGVASAPLLLASVLAAYRLVCTRGIVQLSPELPGSALRRLGQSRSHIASVSLQSAIAEEVFSAVTQRLGPP
jgi:hypothetical protein